MAHIPRHDDILTIISRLRTVSVQELTERLGVSEVTIRKDLTMLEEMGHVVRTHGGAKLAEDLTSNRNFEIRRTEHLREKRAIAGKARDLVSEGDTIYLDSGSTCLYLARELINMNLRVVTNSLAVMNTLADGYGISLFSAGGSYRREAGSFLGSIAMENIRNFQIETCFIGATGISREGKFSSQNIIESELKKQVLSISRRRIVLADSSKYPAQAFSIFARIDDVDILVTDESFPDSVKFHELGLEVLSAPLGSMKAGSKGGNEK